MQRRRAPIKKTLSEPFGVIVDSDTHIGCERVVAIARRLSIREPVGKRAAPTIIDFQGSDILHGAHGPLQRLMTLGTQQALCQ